MRQATSRFLAAIVGDSRRFTLEHRLFNTITLLNGVANLAGAALVFDSTNYFFLVLLQLGTGLLFLLFYYVSRRTHIYRPLYWPFILLMIAFLFANSLGNAGSFGGAHYYFVPALVIATILSTKARTTVMALIVFGATAATLFTIERLRPGWVTQHSGPTERFYDITGNFIFVQVFTGILVMVLARNLNQERRKSDLLLLNILPESIASELKRNERVEPLQYESASVMFTDFVGFTRIAESMKPQQLIAELHRCFSEFDQIARRHRLEKIKTIGDAYMAVGGVPVANGTHPVDCVLAALEIRAFMDQLQFERESRGESYWQLRIGIHTGPLVAGVIGCEKFAYDVWGDTVNTASRMESSGEAGRINISGAAHERVRDFFECEYRGKISAKNKGEIEMYFVKSIRPDLRRSTSEGGPNEAFLDLYGTLRAVKGENTPR